MQARGIQIAPRRKAGSPSNPDIEGAPVAGELKPLKKSPFGQKSPKAWRNASGAQMQKLKAQGGLRGPRSESPSAGQASSTQVSLDETQTFGKDFVKKPAAPADAAGEAETTPHNTG